MTGTDGLGDEQQYVIDLVLQGKSVFVTGAAGTGKSFLLTKLRQVGLRSMQTSRHTSESRQGTP